MVEPLVDKYLELFRVRYWLYQQISVLSPRPLEPRFTKVALIGDYDFWKCEPEGRNPISRDYLARIVDALDVAGAPIIALDIKERLPDPQSNEIPPPYLAETDTLIRSIARAAEHGRLIVLSRTIVDDGDGGFITQPDIYQSYGICVARDRYGKPLTPYPYKIPISPKAQRNITCGYIALPPDKRRLPLTLDVGANHHLDSFALAIARAWDHYGVPAANARTDYGSYISGAALEARHATFDAAQLFRGPRSDRDPKKCDPKNGSSSWDHALDPDTAFWKSLRHFAVIVGGEWSSSGYGAGDLIDQHYTPVGTINGAIIHENFAEAILDGRTFAYFTELDLHLLEIVFAIAAAFVFAAYSGFWVKLGVFAGLTTILVLIQWAMLLVFGTFFDAFIPLLGLWLHSLIERFVGH